MRDALHWGWVGLFAAAWLAACGGDNGGGGDPDGGADGGMDTDGGGMDTDGGGMDTDGGGMDTDGGSIGCDFGLQWSHVLAASGMNPQIRVFDVAPLSGGAVAVVGTMVRTDVVFGSDTISGGAFVAVLNADGSLRWSKTGSGIPALATDGAGTVAWSFAGEVAWASAADGTVQGSWTVPGGGAVQVVSLDVDDDGSVLVVGRITVADVDLGGGLIDLPDGEPGTVFAVKLDASGAHQWDWHVPIPADSSGVSIDKVMPAPAGGIFLSDGSVLVSARVGSVAGGSLQVEGQTFQRNQSFFVKLDSTGSASAVWPLYGGTDFSGYWPRALRPTGDGGYLLLVPAGGGTVDLGGGTTVDFTGTNGALLTRHDGSGALQWHVALKRTGSGSATVGLGAVGLAGGRLWVGGMAESEASFGSATVAPPAGVEAAAFVAALDAASGAVELVHVVGTTPPGSRVSVSSLAALGAEQVVVGGGFETPGSSSSPSIDLGDGPVSADGGSGFVVALGCVPMAGGI